MVKTILYKLTMSCLPVDERDDGGEDLGIEPGHEPLESVDRGNVGRAAAGRRRARSQARARTRSGAPAAGTAHHGRRAAAENPHQIVQSHPEQLSRPRRRLRADKLELASGTWTMNER